MLGYIVSATRSFIVVAALLLSFGSVSVNALTNDSSTTIDAILCTPASTIAITSPVSDSIVTDPSVPLEGTVTQSNQIEVYIDTVFDHIIPTTPGQTSFSDSVQLTEGTHAVKVVAINACAGANGESQAVVTYQKPETGGGTGDGDSSGTDTSTEAGVYIGERVPSSESAGGDGDDRSDLLPPLAVMAPLLEWLNIKTADIGETQGLSVWRAVMMTAGMYLVTVGMATVVVQSVASLPALQAVLPSAPATTRGRWVSRGFRVGGLLLVLAALFL